MQFTDGAEFECVTITTKKKQTTKTTLTKPTTKNPNGIILSLKYGQRSSKCGKKCLGEIKFKPQIFVETVKPGKQ